MPINSLKTLKAVKLKLASLPKAESKNKASKDDSLVKVFDVHSNFGGMTCDFNELCFLDFAIKNLSNYSIRNIRLFFVYKNYRGDVISYSAKEFKDAILPQLALQFRHFHHVKYFKQWDKRSNAWKYGNIDIRILDYEIYRSSGASPADLLFK